MSGSAQQRAKPSPTDVIYARVYASWDSYYDKPEPERVPHAYKQLAIYAALRVLCFPEDEIPFITQAAEIELHGRLQTTPGSDMLAGPTDYILPIDEQMEPTESRNQPIRAFLGHIANFFRDPYPGN